MAYENGKVVLPLDDYLKLLAEKTTAIKERREAVKYGEDMSVIILYLYRANEKIRGEIDKLFEETPWKILETDNQYAIVAR